MKYTVGYNWDETLFSKIDYPEIESVYAGTGDSVIGSGRAPLVIQSVNESQIKRSIDIAHKQGLKFEFTLNSGCISNKEFTKEGHREIVEYLEWLDELGVDSITVTLPSIINIAKRYVPNMKIKVSTFQKIASVESAKRFEALGVDAIMLAENCNRDFKLLEEIRKAVECKMVLIANVGCVFQCPNSHSHIVSTAHSCDRDAKQSIFTIIPHSADCMIAKLENPTNIIKARYIRPEDVYYYEDIGIDMLKLCDRHTKTDMIEERVKAYVERKYSGNLMNIIGQKSERKSDEINSGEFEKLLNQSEECEKKTFKYFNFSISDLIYIDNDQYPADYLKHFMNNDCIRTNCSDCNYCEKIAKQVLTVKADEIQEVVKGLKVLKEKMCTGSILC